ncbi:MAG: DEAD/DEAH box helicase [Chloroflexota bacterium]
MTTEFSQLNLQPELVQTLAELGYETPTPIQSAIIPVMLTGQDVIGQAQTGTGKTAAFSLPVLQNLDKEQRHVQCLVLAPTRELAQQVSKAMYQYGEHVKVRVLPVYGGQPYSRQIGRLKKGVDVVVGTPGRLLDLIKQKALKLHNVSTVILDEADEMLSMGFIEDIEAILSETPETRQTALFSATMPKEIRRLADRYMQSPQSFTIQSKELTVDRIEQRYYLLNESDKLAGLTRLFEVEPITSALIFAKTRLGTGDLANELTVRGFPAEALNGDLSQEARERVLNRFRKHQIKVLVATDVAARGLDIDDISHVINFDLPQDPEVYVHRIGRTGRAGKTGIAITLITPREQWRLRKIENYSKTTLTQATPPTTEEIQTHREAALLEQLKIWLRRGRCRREREIVSELAAEGHDPIQVAAIALKLARAEEKQRPIAPISEVKPVDARSERGGRRGNRRQERDRDNSFARDNKKSRNRDRDGFRDTQRPRKRRETDEIRESHEEGMVRLNLGIGHAQGVRASHIVGTLAFHADIPGYVIGRISIQDEHTFVDVPEEFVGQVLAKSGKYQIGKRPVPVERA